MSQNLKLETPTEDSWYNIGDFGEILAESTQIDQSLHRSTLFVAGVPGNAISGAVACLACELEHLWRVLTTFPL